MKTCKTCRDWRHVPSPGKDDDGYCVAYGYMTDATESCRQWRKRPKETP